MFNGVKGFARRPASPNPAPPPGIASGRPVAVDDARFMARALALAARGVNTTHPNPRVGCVVVAEGGVVGEGWHRAAGGDHAEIIALRQAGKRAAEATLYLTLEPCNHYGRTPPCTDAVVAAGIRRAVIALEDPNPRVDGGGVAALRRAGIDVTVGVGAQSAHRLNRGFCQRMSAGRPWVTLKMAASLDGKTAMSNGESQWITGPAARRDAHQLRAASSAILTGVGTVLRDDPRMTARLDGVHRQPLRVILDSRLSTPPQAKILRPPGAALIITSEAGDPGHLRGAGAEVITCGEHASRIDLRRVMRELAEREVNDLLVEAGPRLSGSLLKQRLVDQIVVYVSPDLLGNDARGLFDIPGLERIADRHRLAFADVRRVGGDLRLTLDVVGGAAPARP